MIMKPVLVATEYYTFRLSVHVISNCIINEIKCISPILHLITDHGIRLEIYTRNSKKYICILVDH